MTITLTKTKAALAVVVLALLIPATAYAANNFTDVPAGKFYAEPVDWAFNNNITTGKTPTSFAPEDNVTRGETVTFLKRYNDNIVEPADQTNADAAAAAQADADTNAGEIDENADNIAALPEIMWAVTDSDGSLDRSSDGVTASRDTIGTYFIDFPRDITDSAMTGSAGLSGSTSSEDPHMVTVVGRFENPNSIFLETHDPSGTLSDAGTHVVVTCPADTGLLLVPSGAADSATLPGNLPG